MNDAREKAIRNNRAILAGFQRGMHEGNGSKCEKCGHVIRPFHPRRPLDAERTRFEHTNCPEWRF